MDKTLYEVRYELDQPAGLGSIPWPPSPAGSKPPPAPPAGRLRPGEGPFTFMACMELREFVGLRAENERELAQLLDEVPLDSIYYHTHGFLLRHAS